MKLRTIVITTGMMMGTAALLSCGKGGPLNADNIGNALGGQAGALVKAGGRGMNAAALNEKDEDALGQSVGVSLTSTYGVYHDPKLETYVTLVGLTVASASPNPAGNYVFGILDTEEVNAFSGPNGYIFVTRGLLEKTHDEAELAGVLGHEIAHVCHHDGLNQIKTAETEGALSDAAKAATGNAQFMALADVGVDVITKTGYSQPQEFAADQDGVKFMSAAGYDPNSYLRLLERLDRIESSGGAKIMSTHPGMSDRVKRVATEIQKMNSHGAATLGDRFAMNVPLSHP